MRENESNLVERLNGGEIVFSSRGDLALPLLRIPNSVLEKLGGRDRVRDLHRELFDGSNPLGGEQLDIEYVVEFPKGTTQEQVQPFIDRLNQTK